MLPRTDSMRDALVTDALERYRVALPGGVASALAFRRELEERVRAIQEGATFERAPRAWRGVFADVWVALEPIPEAGIAAGDLLLRPCARRVPPGAVRGRVEPIRRAALPAVRAAINALRLLDSSWEWGTEEERRAKLAGFLRGAARKWSAKRADTDGLIIVRTLRSPVSVPIEARSDDGALYELLRSVGCTLPRPVREEG